MYKYKSSSDLLRKRQQQKIKATNSPHTTQNDLHCIYKDTLIYIKFVSYLGFTNKQFGSFISDPVGCIISQISKHKHNLENKQH